MIDGQQNAPYLSWIQTPAWLYWPDILVKEDVGTSFQISSTHVFHRFAAAFESDGTRQCSREEHSTYKVILSVYRLAQICVYGVEWTDLCIWGTGRLFPNK